MSAPNSPIPMTILTGFLGAGKTTLLKHILQGDHGLRVSVLINDFAELNIDVELVVNVQDHVVSLANGCVCCTVRSDAVSEILNMLQRDEVPEFIVVETSGVSEPLALAQTFLQPGLRDLFSVESIITVVDAEQISTLSGDYATVANHQMAVADLVVINKTDLVRRETLDHIKDTYIRPAVPDARILETAFGQVPFELVLGAGSYAPGRHANIATPDVHIHAADAELDHDHGVNHSLLFSSWSWTCDQPLSLDALRETMTTLPDGIFRAKGIVYLADAPDRRTVLHVVGRRVMLRLDERWNGEVPQTQLVAIGTPHSLDPVMLERCFKSLVVPSGLNIENLVNVPDSLEWLRDSSG
jgi:G3E family GTPase